MKSITMTKAECALLFLLLDKEIIPTGVICEPPEGEEREALLQTFETHGLMKKTATGFAFDKGLLAFLSPIFQAKKIMILNWAYDSGAVCKSTLYISDTSVFALGEEGDMVHFLSFDTMDELLLHLPNFCDMGGEKFSYLSYILLTEEGQTLHEAVVQGENLIVVKESRNPPKETMSVDEFQRNFGVYQKLFTEKMEVLCHVLCH